MAVGVNALAAIPARSRIYLDTNVWIYALEGFQSFAQPLAELFARIDDGELVAVTSELTLAEALVKPFQSNQHELELIYLDTLQTSETLTVAPVSREVLTSAARLRAQYPSLKLPDAIHAATALAQDARMFITNDARFGTVGALTSIVLNAS